jgi:hypothetical protein
LNANPDVPVARHGICVYPHSYAKNIDTSPGCGLGTLAWADYKHPKNIAPQVMLATTNGTLFNTVGISFGLSGCTNDGTVMAERKAEMFAVSTFENLSQDMARGQANILRHWRL